MRALIFNKKNNNWNSSRGFELVDIPKPTLTKDDADKIIIQVSMAGVCGTDRGIWHRQVFKDQIESSLEKEKKDFRLLGHEFMGTVVEKGSRVTGVSIGDTVACESHVVCNACFQCRNGQENVCVNEKILGISVDGGFAEFVKVPAQVAWKINPSKVRKEIAVLYEPFGNAVHAASKVQLKNKTVLIVGLGPIAQFLILIAKQMGAKKVLGVEPRDSAIAMAKSLGIDHTFKIKPGGYRKNEALVKFVMKLTRDVGADVVFEMAGTNDSLNNSIASVRRGGDVILFGLRHNDFVIEDYNRFIMKGVNLYCVAGRQIWKTWDKTKALLESTDSVIAKKLWSVLLKKGQGTILPIGEFTNKKFESMMRQYPKILLKF